jgi:hypothetical protein
MLFLIKPKPQVMKEMRNPLSTATLFFPFMTNSNKLGYTGTNWNINYKCTNIMLE